jgi:[ribosomal protein S5]-alanine N-acetyltransferase
MRPLNMNDVDDLYKLDSDALVIKYLGNRPVKNLDEVNVYLKSILKQYETYGIGRWAVVEKSTGEMIGWAGLKFMNEETNGHKDFYDVGYRFCPEFWGKGYATEATNAWTDYAKNHLNVHTLYASAHTENIASQNVLKKCGFIQKSEYQFEMNGENLACYWFELELM